MAQKKKWAQNVKVKEGALGKIGWPNVGTIISNIRSGKVDRKTAISRLNFIANVGSNKKAKAAIVRIGRELGTSKPKPKRRK